MQHKYIGQLTKIAALVTLLPLSAMAQTYDFKAAVNTAINSNPEMGVSAARIEQAKAAKSKAESSRMPQINLSVTGSYSNNPLNVFGMKMQQAVVEQADFNPALLNNPDAYGDINTRIEILIPVWNGGKIKSFEEQASEMIKAAQDGDQAVQQYLTFNVYQAYEAVHAARAYIKVAEQAKKTADEFVRTTQNMVEQGIVVRSEFLSAKVNQSAAELAMVKAKGQEQIALDGLRVLMNLDAEAPVDVADRVNLQLNIDAASEAVNVALAQNPILQAKRQEAKASVFAIDAARADEKPSFNMMVRQDWNDTGLGFGASSYTIAGVANWKITDFGVTKGSIDMANAAAGEKRASVESEENKVRSDVMTAWHKLQIAKKQVESSILTVQQAEEALSLIMKRHENGVATITEVLASQTQLDKARAELVAAQFEVNLQKAKLRLNMGTMTVASIN